MRAVKVDPANSVTLRVPVADALSTKLTREARKQGITVPQLVAALVREHLREKRS